MLATIRMFERSEAKRRRLSSKLEDPFEIPSEILWQSSESELQNQTSEYKRESIRNQAKSSKINRNEARNQFELDLDTIEWGYYYFGVFF